MESTNTDELDKLRSELDCALRRCRELEKLRDESARDYRRIREKFFSVLDEIVKIKMQLLPNFINSSDSDSFKVSSVEKVLYAEEIMRLNALFGDNI